MEYRTRVARVYDNGGETIDRFTLVFETFSRGCDVYCCRCLSPYCYETYMVGSSPNPSHPQGFWQHTTGIEGDHLGKEIRVSDLPEEVRIQIRNEEDFTE
jgi:hypothetical protein